MRIPKTFRVKGYQELFQAFDKQIDLLQDFVAEITTFEKESFDARLDGLSLELSIAVRSDHLQDFPITKGMLGKFKKKGIKSVLLCNDATEVNYNLMDDQKAEEPVVEKEINNG